MLRWLTLAFALAFALVVAGCGGSSSTASETTTTTETVTESTTTETTTSGEATTTSGETTTEAAGNGSGLPSANCIQAVTAFAALGQAAAGAAGANTDESLSAFQKYTDSAPSEIRDDLKVLFTAYAKYIKTLNDLGLKQGDTPNADQIAKLSKASEELSTPEIQAASQHWDAWATKNCKQ